jgi:hypothetical protein
VPWQRQARRLRYQSSSTAASEDTDVFAGASAERGAIRTPQTARASARARSMWTVLGSSARLAADALLAARVRAPSCTVANARRTDITIVRASGMDVGVFLMPRALVELRSVDATLGTRDG